MNAQVPDMASNDSKSVIYRRFDDGYIVRAMVPSDVEIMQNWYCGLGIVSINFDILTALEVFPPGGGFYMGEINGETVACAIRIPWSKNVFYGSHYHVTTAHRGKGYGTRLRDQVAREFVGDNMLSIDVHMVPGPIIEKNIARFDYEFADDFKSARLSGKAKDSYGITWKSGNIVKASEVNFAEITAFDDKCFVGPNNPVRHNFLKKWIAVPGGETYIALDDKGRIVGMGCRRPCLQEKHHMVGPLYAENQEIAEALLQKHCKDITGHTFMINIWCRNKGACSMGEKFGLESVLPLIRMNLNGNPQEFKSQVFGTTSVDVCGF